MASKCNLNAARAVLFGCALLLMPDVASAQRDTALFLGGAALALGAHEAGHVVFDVAFSAEPGLKKVSFAGIPFFAITHRAVSRRREFIISSAGFWVQHLSNEILLNRSGPLRSRHAPVLKGMLTFNVLASAAYATAAFARVGPEERDTRGMAASADIPEPTIGALILAPAAFDALRYYKPDAAAIVWASRAAKIAGAMLVLKAK